MAKKRSTALSIAILIAVIALLLAAARMFFGEAQAREPEISTPETYPKEKCAPGASSVFACAVCKPSEVSKFAPQYSDGHKCICRYCVSESTGKSIADGDVWNIYCLEEKPDS